MVMPSPPDDGSIWGMNIEAKRLIKLLDLDSPKYREYRKLFFDIVAMAKREDNSDLWFSLMKYPDDLPDLTTLRPRENSRPDGINQSCHARRFRGQLPQTY